MRTCEHHEDETSRHMKREGGKMIAVCCYCWLEAGLKPSQFHPCPE